MSLIYSNCPYFKIGCCIKEKCKYRYHIICKNNYTCSNYECPYGHGISILKRKILLKLYEKLYDLNFNENNSCINPLKCINNKCNLSHHFAFKEREFLFKLFNEKNNLNAKELYENNYSYNLDKKYYNLDNISDNSSNSSNSSFKNNLEFYSENKIENETENEMLEYNIIKFENIENELNLLIEDNKDNTDNLENLLLELNNNINKKSVIEQKMFDLLKININYDKKIQEIQLKIQNLFIFKNRRI